MKKIFITTVVFMTLILAGSVHTFGLAQVNLESSISGKCNTDSYNDLALSGNVVLPVVGVKIDAEYDLGKVSGSDITNIMVGGGIRLFKFAGLSLFAGADYLGSTIKGVQAGTVFYDASLEWRIGDHVSVDAWIGNSLTASYNGISSPNVWGYRGRVTYWIIPNAGISAGTKRILLQTGLPDTNYDLNIVYLGAAVRL